MKLSELVKNYSKNMFLKAKLNKSIKIGENQVLKKGTQSELLIQKSNGKYHFEALGIACDVDSSEIDIIEKTAKAKNKLKK